MPPLGSLLNHPVMHRLFAHPVEDRFEAADFREGMRSAGLQLLQERQLWGAMSWFVAAKPNMASGELPPVGARRRAVVEPVMRR